MHQLNDVFFYYHNSVCLSLVYLSVYLSVLLLSPGNMLRSPDGRLVILDFGLMTRITDDQKYGMIEAIAHLIHRCDR